MPGDDSARDLRFPGVDEHLVTPETTRDEVVRGRRMVAFPAHRPHATRQSKVDFLVAGNVVPGYESAVEMLTRVGEGSDFAADVAVLRQGIDPSTGNRYLEELAFEIVSEQSMRDITIRAEDLSNRGVRRVIAIFLKLGEVREWDRAHNDWRILPLDSEFSDPVLVRAFPVRALLDSKLGANAVAKALEATSNEAIVEMKAAECARGLERGIEQGIEQGRAEGIERGRAEGIERGRAEGIAESLLLLLGMRGLQPTDPQREAITSCTDVDRLLRWLKAANQVESFGDLLSVQ
ncbi:MAG: hypothetical protein HC927_09210 [Deltaproteobacteria bacterium]|nr:hypothetical protein [Deltaproteobacteria bacterium]